MVRDRIDLAFGVDQFDVGYGIIAIRGGHQVVGYLKQQIHEAIVEMFEEIGLKEHQDFVLVRHQPMDYMIAGTHTVNVIFNSNNEFVLAKLALT